MFSVVSECISSELITAITASYQKQPELDGEEGRSFVSIYVVASQDD